ncbi:MAG: hypothetical protein ACOC29_01645, partial [Candidatus Sumerlaeota bacterium]
GCRWRCEKTSKHILPLSKDYPALRPSGMKYLKISAESAADTSLGCSEQSERNPGNCARH